MSDIIKAQQGFARKAETNRTHRFEDLYHLLCKSEWIEEALQHVLDNDGAGTAGVDGMSWKAFHDVDKSDFENEKFRQQFIESLQEELRKHTFKPMPVRRVEIPKPGTNKKRPLGIPIRVVHYLSFQAMFGIPCVLLLVDQNLRSTFIDLLYHVFSLQASSATLPMSLSRLAQLLDDVWSEGNPAWAMWMSRDAIWVAVGVGDHSRTRSTTCGLVWRSSHDILYRGMERAVRASVCQRIATSMTLPRLESVTSLINQRMSCLRSTKVVVEACQMAGRS